MSSCTAGIGFVIENEMKSFSLLLLLIADYRFVLPAAVIAAELRPDRR